MSFLHTTQYKTSFKEAYISINDYIEIENGGVQQPLKSHIRHEKDASKAQNLDLLFYMVHSRPTGEHEYHITDMI